MSGIMNNSDRRNAIYCIGATNIFTNESFLYTFKNTSLTDRPLLDIPLSDVRSGVLGGTLAVPPPSSVLTGVPTDNTVGTYSATPALIAAQVRTELAVELARIDAAISSRLADVDYEAPNNADITAIKAVTDTLTDVATETDLLLVKAKTDLIPTNPASVQNVGAIVSSYNV